MKVLSVMPLERAYPVMKVTLALYVVVNDVSAELEAVPVTLAIPVIRAIRVIVVIRVIAATPAIQATRAMAALRLHLSHRQIPNIENYSNR